MNNTLGGVTDAAVDTGDAEEADEAPAESGI
jgi:hypothetical protein